MQAPLAFTRVTSRFTSSRKHPILGYSRPHMGVDYGAPTGTPVKAVGEGVVTKRSWGGGYGNQIIVKHVAGLESMYTVLLQRDSRNEVCLQRINAYLRQEFDYELDHQEQVYLLIHLTKIVG